MRKKTIWDLDYQAIIKFAEEDHKKAVKEDKKYAVLKEIKEKYEREILKIK
jgi:hypothetical protein